MAELLKKKPGKPNKFWAFIKEGGDMADLLKKKPNAGKPKKTHRRSRRAKSKKKHGDVIVTLQKGNESIRVNQDDLVDKLVELLPDVKLIKTEDEENDNSKIKISGGGNQEDIEIVNEKNQMNDTLQEDIVMNGNGGQQ